MKDEFKKFIYLCTRFFGQGNPVQIRNYTRSCNPDACARMPCIVFPTIQPLRLNSKDRGKVLEIGKVRRPAEEKNRNVAFGNKSENSIWQCLRLLQTNTRPINSKFFHATFIFRQLCKRVDVVIFLFQPKNERPDTYYFDLSDQLLTISALPSPVVQQ